MSRLAHKVNKRFVAYAAVVIVAAFLVGRSQLQAEKLETNVAENHRLAKSLQSGLIESCKVNGNPLRVTVQGLLHEQISSARKTRASFFPNIPAATFHRLIRESIEAKRKRLATIAPVNCGAQYRGSR